MRTKNGIIDKVERFSVGCCVWHCENGMCIDECNCIGTHLEDIVNQNNTWSGEFLNQEYINDENELEGEIYENNKDIAQKCIVLFPIN